MARDAGNQLCTYSTTFAVAGPAGPKAERERLMWKMLGGVLERELTVWVKGFEGSGGLAHSDVIWRAVLSWIWVPRTKCWGVFTCLRAFWIVVGDTSWDGFAVNCMIWVIAIL